MPEDVFRWVVAIAVILACIALVVQAGMVVALYAAIKKTQAKLTPVVDKAGPMIASGMEIIESSRKVVEATRELLAENRPRIAEIAIDAVAITHDVRGQVGRVGEFVHDATGRAKVRIAQIDEKVDATVEHVEQVGEAVKSSVMRPVREVNGVAAGIKAAVSAYGQGRRRNAVERATQDEEMFI